MSFDTVIHFSPQVLNHASQERLMPDEHARVSKKNE